VKGLGLIVGGTLALAIAAIVGPAALAGDKPNGGDERSAVSRTDLIGVNFVESCRYSHQAPDDPIVFPGKAGASHMHTFVGARTTNASSTFGSLRSGGTTCQRRDDTAAYWVPALYQGSSQVLPQGATIYYRRGTTAEVSPFPNNLRVIAGDATATSPQGMRITSWSCGAESGIDRSASVPTCPDSRGSFLRLHIRFPECWDGRRLDSPDHKSHMAYAARGACPSSHPVEVPQITQIYRYPTRGGEGFSLASGGVYSAHADFVNAWKPGALRKLVDGCLNALVHCGRG
jgi:Domain of unknown function (DUF1996)